ncbi:head-tail connector protein [Sphingomonas morindae]|uniref:PhiE125 gp8 family phage protein n=1 Tax=Sphingomonas morindae TaxID=1541170 RepID=A0ABY4X3K5_9SPHN|nr:hypothetical protein [Sphingomonas morindae]USI71469.1 hypothetical protein LHA26_08950 [Sphingomonas morindae]
MMADTDEAGPAEALVQAKAYLRIEDAAEDGLLAGLVGSALALCERFTGVALLAREQEARLDGAEPGWQRLPATPVAAIAAPRLGGQALAAADYATDIDAAGDGWVRLRSAQPGVVTVRFTAGLASGWPGLPAPLRQGVVRLAAHLHAHRDEAEAAAPPAAVAALWRPWRRMRLR